MAISFIADQHRPAQAIHVDCNEDGVDLTVCIEPDEIISFGLPFTKIDDDLAWVAAHHPKDDLPGRLAAEISRLRRIIGQAHNQQEIIRNLYPAECRELAAILRHFAEEAERR